MTDAREVIAAVLEFKFQADTIIAALSAAGLVIVPKEPTEEMVNAAQMVIWNTPDDTTMDDTRKMMIAAAIKEGSER